jgi:hypothetical protein
VRVAAREDANGLRDGLVKAFLLAIVVRFDTRLLEPRLRRHFQSLGQRDLPASRFALQARR